MAAESCISSAFWIAIPCDNVEFPHAHDCRTFGRRKVCTRSVGASASFGLAVRSWLRNSRMHLEAFILFGYVVASLRPGVDGGVETKAEQHWRNVDTCYASFGHRVVGVVIFCHSVIGT